MDLHLFRFFLSGEEKEISSDSGLWKMPLAGKNTKKSCGITEEHSNPGSNISIGDYFLASSQFLSKNNFSFLKIGLNSVFKNPVKMDQIEKIALFLEKHGAYYHPLKIQIVLLDKRTCSFVLNGAVSKPGLDLIESEYYQITRLNQSRSGKYLPQVFGVDFIIINNIRYGFFLGEWFENYKEFHATQKRDEKKVVIWNSDGTSHTISEDDALPIYREISLILTHYYNIETFEEISSWHHAAGDFVARQDGEKYHVRLITVRKYLPISEFGGPEEDNKVHILPSLLFFFLNLSLRIRLDRLDGTGKIVMLSDKIVTATIEGFLSGLDEKSLCYDYGDLRVTFIQFFCQFDLEQIIVVMQNILESNHPNPSEIKLIEENLKSHCKNLYSIFKNM